MSKHDNPCLPETQLPVDKADGDIRGIDGRSNTNTSTQADKKASPVISVEGKKINCTQDYANILECLEDSDVEVHFHCRDGFCGACRITLCQGEVVYPQGEPLAFVGEGEILTCCSLPITDITLELD